MIKTLTLISLVVLLAVTGCATTQNTMNCPNEDSVFLIVTPFGPVAVVIERGFLNEENRGINWATKGEYEMLMQDEKEPGRPPLFQNKNESQVKNEGEDCG